MPFSAYIQWCIIWMLLPSFLEYLKHMGYVQASLTLDQYYWKNKEVCHGKYWTLGKTLKNKSLCKGDCILENLVSSLTEDSSLSKVVMFLWSNSCHTGSRTAFTYFNSTKPWNGMQVVTSVPLCLVLFLFYCSGPTSTLNTVSFVSP